MRHSPLTHMAAGIPGWGGAMANVMTVMSGMGGFFEPNPWAPFADFIPMSPEQAAYHKTAPLERTLSDLIDLDVLNACTTRLTVGAAHVQTGEMRYFDSYDNALSIKHIMA